MIRVLFLSFFLLFQMHVGTDSFFGQLIQESYAQKKKKKSKRILPYSGQWLLSSPDGVIPNNKYRLLFYSSRNEVRGYITDDEGSSLPVGIYTFQNGKPKKNLGSTMKAVFSANTDSANIGSISLVPADANDLSIFGSRGSLLFNLSPAANFLEVTVKPNEASSFILEGVLEKYESTRIVSRIKRKKKKKGKVKAGSRLTVEVSAENKGPGALSECQSVLIVTLPDAVDASTIRVSKTPLECATNTPDPDLVGQVQCCLGGPSLGTKRSKVSANVSFVVPEELSGERLTVASTTLEPSTTTPYIAVSSFNVDPGSYSSNIASFGITIKASNKVPELAADCPAQVLFSDGSNKTLKRKDDTGNSSSLRTITCLYELVPAEVIRINYIPKGKNNDFTDTGCTKSNDGFSYNSGVRHVNVQMQGNVAESVKGPLARGIIRAFEPLAERCK